MPCAKTYTIDEVNRILQESEGRPSPNNLEPGHALSLHFDARGQQLADRVLPRGRAIKAPSGTRGNPGHEPISRVGRPIVLGASAVDGPASRQDVLDTWGNYELEQARIAKADQIALLRSSNKSKNVEKGDAMALDPLLTDISRNKKKELDKDYSMDFEGAEFSGAFADRQQAIQIGRNLLNSTDGQARLARLDAGTKRVEIMMDVPAVMDTRAVKIHLASRDTLGGDTPVLTDISRAYMVVDRLDSGEIHIQTFFPIA